MKKKPLMITLLLAFFGCVLIVLSIYFLYQGSYSANVKVLKTKRELELANKKIAELSEDIDKKSKYALEIEKKFKKIKSESFGQISGMNIPIVEIGNVNIGDEDDDDHGGKRKTHKLMYNHQIRFALLNIGKSSLKDVIFSIKDIYNDPKSKVRKAKSNGHASDNNEIGMYDNIEVNTLNLKSKKMIFTSNLPSSFGVGDYSYHVIIEWSKGFYQMMVKIEEIDGKLKFKYEYFDADGKEIDFKSLEDSIKN
jgi:hypothetical protein